MLQVAISLEAWALFYCTVFKMLLKQKWLWLWPTSFTDLTACLSCRLCSVPSKHWLSLCLSVGCRPNSHSQGWKQICSDPFMFCSIQEEFLLTKLLNIESLISKLHCIGHHICRRICFVGVGITSYSLIFVCILRRALPHCRDLPGKTVYKWFIHEISPLLKLTKI